MQLWKIQEDLIQIIVPRVGNYLSMFSINLIFILRQIWMNYVYTSLIASTYHVYHIPSANGIVRGENSIHKYMLNIQNRFLWKHMAH